jgi:hypothetical protein
VTEAEIVHGGEDEESEIVMSEEWLKVPPQLPESYNAHEVIAQAGSVL